MVDCLSAVVDRLPRRTEYPASKYSNRDAVNSAFAAFFFQFPSLLRYMRENKTLKTESARVINNDRVLDGGVLLALDGLWYVSSENMHYAHFITKTVKDKEGNEETRYYHAAVVGAIVKPGGTKVLPVAPEIISNSDGAKKQDCELKEDVL